MQEAATRALLQRAGSFACGDGAEEWGTLLSDLVKYFDSLGECGENGSYAARAGARASLAKSLLLINASRKSGDQGTRNALRRMVDELCRMATDVNIPDNPNPVSKLCVSTVAVLGSMFIRPFTPVDEMLLQRLRESLSACRQVQYSRETLNSLLLRKRRLGGVALSIGLFFNLRSKQPLLETGKETLEIILLTVRETLDLFEDSTGQNSYAHRCSIFLQALVQTLLATLSNDNEGLRQALYTCKALCKEDNGCFSLNCGLLIGQINLALRQYDESLQAFEQNLLYLDKVSEGGKQNISQKWGRILTITLHCIADALSQMCCFSEEAVIWAQMLEHLASSQTVQSDQTASFISIGLTCSVCHVWAGHCRCEAFLNADQVSYKRARALYQSGSPKKALQVLEQGCKLDAFNSEMNYLYASLLVEAGRCTEAISVCDQAVSRHGNQVNDAEFILVKADALAALGCVSQALKEVKRIKEGNHDPISVRQAKSNEAVLLFWVQKQTQAVSLLKELSANKGSNNQALEEHIAYHHTLFLYDQGEDEAAAKAWCGHRNLVQNTQALTKARANLAVICNVEDGAVQKQREVGILDVQALSILTSLPQVFHSAKRLKV